jgi:hypothetical protein
MHRHEPLAGALLARRTNANAIGKASRTGMYGRPKK